MKISNLIETLEFFYPKDLAESWDNVGLLVGDKDQEITNVLTTLEITLDVVYEAIERDANIIVAHHPIIFKPLKNLNFNDPINKILKVLIKHDIAVYCMHTNVDIAANGMNDWLCEILDIKYPAILSPTKIKNYHKITIETSQEKLSDCIDLLKTTSIGQKGKKIQNYNITPKVKYFKDLDKKEAKKDLLVIDSFVKDEDLIEIRSKFYENKVFNYQISPIENLKDVYGLGRIGKIKPISLDEFAYKIKDLFKLEAVSIVGSREKIIKKVAIVGGSGSSLISDAVNKGADLLITGDIGFHDAQLALSQDISLIDPGHSIEIIFNDYMADFINALFDINAMSSEIDTNPFEVIA